jgi:hypothetical protein
MRGGRVRSCPGRGPARDPGVKHGSGRARRRILGCAARTPGLGSAIFLHVNIGMPTAGCVTLPTGELLEILRWLNPAVSPRITMGVGTRRTAGG